MTKKTIKCKACYDKGYYTQFVGEIGGDDFGGEGYSLPPTIKKFPCPKCIRIQNGHKEDCDFVNSDQGVCNCFRPEQKECEHKWIMLDEIVQCCKCQIPKPAPQPTEQKECNCHCHDTDWEKPFTKDGRNPIQCFPACACNPPISDPQPTDGLINYAPILDAGQAGFTGIHADRYWVVRENCIRQLLAEQKQKTREDTLNNIEAIWTRLMNETDDPVYKEIYASCIKALKI